MFHTICTLNTYYIPKQYYLLFVADGVRGTNWIYIRNTRSTHARARARAHTHTHTHTQLGGFSLHTKRHWGEIYLSSSVYPSVSLRECSILGFILTATLKEKENRATTWNIQKSNAIRHTRISKEFDGEVSHSVLKRLMWLHGPSQDNHHVIQLAKILTNVRHHIHKTCVSACACVPSLSTPTSLSSSASKITIY
jgi:hypothetical protein